MAKKVINSDIYNLAQLVKDIGGKFISNEDEETLAIGMYGYINDVESHRLQTQVQMTGELSNEIFPSRARLERNVITHAIMAGIDDINAVPHHMTVYIQLAESDVIDNLDSNNEFVIDRECPIYIGDYEFHLEFDIILKQIKIVDKSTNTYSARYSIPSKREVPTSSITTDSQYLSSPAIIKRNGAYYILITAEISQVTHTDLNKKLITSNIIDNKVVTFQFSNQLAYFEVEIDESDGLKYLQPVFEGSSVPSNSYDYYCWYQYIDTDIIRVRFDRNSYMPGLNANVNILVKTTTGKGEGDIIYKDDIGVDLTSDTYGYKNISAIITPLTNATGGKDRKTKEELQKLIPKELLARGSLTTITDLNNYFSTLDTEDGRIIIQKKMDNQIERVYYAYLVAKDSNNNIIPSNTIDIKVGLEDLVKFRMTESKTDRYVLSSGACIKLGSDGIGYINHDPLMYLKESFTVNPCTRGKRVTIKFKAIVNEDIDSEKNVGCGASVSGANTPIYVYPANYTTYASSTSAPITVEDYMLLSAGQQYLFTAEYSTKIDSTSIDILTSDLKCMTFVSGYYTLGNSTKQYEIPSLPYKIDGLESNTKINVYIIAEKNANTNRVTVFTRDDKKTTVAAGVTTYDIDDICSKLGINNIIRDVTTSNDELFSVLNEGDNEWRIDLLQPTFDTTETITIRTDYGYYHISTYQLDNIIEYNISLREYDETGTGVKDTTLLIDGANRDNVIIVYDEEAYVTGKTLVLKAIETIVGYTCYIPSIVQDNYPETLDIGDEIDYTLTYISTSGLVSPDVVFSLSKGLSYVPFSTTISYEDGESYTIEPTESEIKNDGFIYTNPYAIAINGYSLYSAFYMMSMEESHYFHFDWINQKSNIQFIASTMSWVRPFIDNNMEYTMKFQITQSVSENLGIFDTEDETADPKIKAVAVFYRNSKPYRYRTLRLSSYDKSTYSFVFEQSFISVDTMDNDNNIKVLGYQATGQKESGILKYTLSGNEMTKDFTTDCTNDKWDVKEFLAMFNINISSADDIESYRSSDSSVFDIEETEATSTTSKAITIYLRKVFNTDQFLKFTINGTTYEIDATCKYLEYGYLNPTSEMKIYILTGVADIEGSYSRYDFDSICPLVDKNWTVTNIYSVVNGVTLFHNYSEIMESRIVPYGDSVTEEENTVLDLKGYYVASVPVISYDYAKDETLVQYAIDGLNYRKSYIDNVLELLENSFCIDFKLFNTYGPSNTFYIMKDSNENKVLDDTKEYIDRVNLSFYFRVKLSNSKDSYTVDNIKADVKSYIEDLDDLGEIHIPNLITQITTNYSEQISYFEYLGFNSYGPEIQHIYKDDDSEIPIHTAPEFININNSVDYEGNLTPDINIYVSEI